MSFENGTTYYGLPITQNNDTRDWFDTNEPFEAIDAAIHSAVETASSGASDIAIIKNDISGAGGINDRLTAAEGSITTLGDDVAIINGQITNLSSKITDVSQDAEDMICAFNEESATSTHSYTVGKYFIYNDVLYKATDVINVGDTIVPNVNCAATNITTEILAIEGGGGGAVIASAVSYDNTTSGLAATNVQGAIDEIVSDIPDISTISSDVSTLKTNLTSDNVSFRFAIQGGDYGYLKADDSFVPFSTGSGASYIMVCLRETAGSNMCPWLYGAPDSLTYVNQSFVQFCPTINNEYVTCTAGTASFTVNKPCIHYKDDGTSVTHQAGEVITYTGAQETNLQYVAFIW